MKTLRVTDPPRTLDARTLQFGGQPTWRTKPMWPMSKSTGEPMRFLCQVPLPPDFAGRQEMAYVFINGGDALVDGSWAARGGENAVILQPGAFRPVVPTKELSIGPTLQRYANGDRELEDVALQVELADLEPGGPFERPMTQYLGEPVWIQNDDTPRRGSWRFLLQIDSNTKQYRLNLADAGVGYVFVSDDGTAARFLWQCY